MIIKYMTITRKFFYSDRGGMAAVEFALLLPVLSLFLIFVADFGLAYNVKLKLLSAIAAGAQYAQSNGSGLTTSNFATFSTAVTAVIQKVANSSSNVTVSTKINNSADGSNADSYYCVSSSPATWVKAASSSTTCGTDLTAGRYVTITVKGSYNALFKNDPVIGSLIELSETIIVRVN